jgi:hypothetical protein
MSYCFSAAALPGGWKARTTIIIIKSKDMDVIAPVFFLDMRFGQAVGGIIRVYVSLNEQAAGAGTGQAAGQYVS